MLVADIGENALESSDRAPRRCGKMHSAVRHQNEQAAHLERYGLATHVRAADQQHPRLVIESQRLRYGTLAEQRMSAALDRDDACILEFRRFGVLRLREPRFCVHEIEGRVDFGIALDLIGMRPDERRKLREDARDLVFLLGAQCAQTIVCVERFERLDEVRLSARARIVDDALECARELCFDRHDESPVAHGHDVVLEHGAITLRAGNGRRTFARLCARRRNAAPKSRQLGRSAIQNFAALADCVVDALRDVRQRDETRTQRDKPLAAAFAYPANRGIPRRNAVADRAQIERQRSPPRASLSRRLPATR